MRNLPVQWSEGMFLRPQHFQAAERYWGELIQTSEKWDHHYNYGLRSVEISEVAIGNYQVDVAACQARMKDGTLIALGLGQEPDRVDLQEAVRQLGHAVTSLKEAFESDSVVRVYLAVPTLKLGRANVLRGDGARHEESDFDEDDEGDDAGAIPRRFIETKLDIQDEVSGGGDKNVDFRALNVRVLLSNQNLAGFEVLPIAQIKRASEQEAAPVLDKDYIPPVVAVDAWPVLHRDYVRAIFDMIGEKIAVLAEQVTSRGITLATQEPGELERLLMLMTLNEAYGSLRILAFAKGVHPLVMYTELCRIVGSLSIFAKERSPGEIPTYDHDDLARIFKWVKKRISELIYAVREYAYEQRYFIGTGRGMQVTLEPKWLNPTWDWYVGVHRGNITEIECRELLNPGQLDWKLGSSRQVDLMFQHGVPGLRLNPLPHAPSALPGGEWIYYHVSREGAAWQDVQSSQTLAMRLRDELVQNRELLQGSRDLVVNSRGKQATLQFSLFAVPKS
jgi:type VI secretion system protein ImpJ